MFISHCLKKTTNIEQSFTTIYTFYIFECENCTMQNDVFVRKKKSSVDRTLDSDSLKWETYSKLLHVWSSFTTLCNVQFSDTNWPYAKRRCHTWRDPAVRRNSTVFHEDLADKRGICHFFFFKLACSHHATTHSSWSDAPPTVWTLQGSSPVLPVAAQTLTSPSWAWHADRSGNWLWTSAIWRGRGQLVTFLNDSGD